MEKSKIGIYRVCNGRIKRKRDILFLLTILMLWIKHFK